jgi:hypothetical protein
MTHDEHKQRHVQLHQGLHELIADWMAQTAVLPSEALVSELVRWSMRQVENPTVNEFMPEEEGHLPVIQVHSGHPDDWGHR